MSLENMLQSAFADLDQLSFDKVQELLQEALKTFESLKEKSRSNDPKERAQAQELAKSLKVALQNQTEELSKIAGVDPSLLANLTLEEDALSPQEWAELNAAKKNLESLQSDPESKPHHHKRTKPIKIFG